MSIQLSDLTKDELIDYIQSILNAFNNFDGIVGDVPVSEQLSAALSQMATKSHKHDEYATCDEVDDLKRKVEMLIDLVGDVSVSEQIDAAIHNT